VKIALLILALGAAARLQAEPGDVRFTSGPSRVALVELYTSEGCSSCPPAERWFAALARDPGLWRDFVPIAFHVDYWNQLGWTDRFSRPAFTQRQFRWAAAWGASSVYTPCFVLNGREWRPSLSALSSTKDGGGMLAIDYGDRRCLIRFAPSAPNPGERWEAHVALLGGEIESHIGSGENAGALLDHEFVALALVDVPLAPEGAAAGAAISIPAAEFAGTRRRALAAWITRSGRPEPVQATGGWIGVD